MTTDAPAPTTTPAPTSNSTPASPAEKLASAYPSATPAPAAPAEPAKPAADAPKDKPADAPAAKPADKPADEPNKDKPADPAPAAGDDPKPSDSDEKKASDGEKPDGEKPEGEAEEGKEPTVQEYQANFVLPEGMEVDTDVLNAAVPILQKHKVPPEAMKEFGPIMASVISKTMKTAADQHEAVVTKWHDQTVAVHGKEGEAVFKEKTAVANRAIKKFFSEDERNALKHYGTGNMSGLFALAYQVGLQMQEDTTGMPSTAGTGAGEETLADVWYPQK